MVPNVPFSLGDYLVLVSHFICWRSVLFLRLSIIAFYYIFHICRCKHVSVGWANILDLASRNHVQETRQ